MVLRSVRSGVWVLGILLSLFFPRILHSDIYPCEGKIGIDALVWTRSNVARVVGVSNTGIMPSLSRLEALAHDTLAGGDHESAI